MRDSAQRGRDFVPEILVGRHAFPWAIPVGATTFRAGLRLLVAVATGDPFVVAPLTAVPHDRDRHSCHSPHLTSCISYRDMVDNDIRSDAYHSL